MFRLFLMLLALPWPVMGLIAAGLFWVAQDSHRSALEDETEKAQALLEPVPAPVALDQFTDADVHLADEVHVTAWINTDHNYELTKQRKGTDTVRRMFVLFGPGDAADSKVARGIVMLRPDEVDAFVMHLMTNVADPMDPRLPFHLNGAVDQTPELSDMVRDAFEERGLTKAEDFVVLTPFLQGREAALAPDPDAPMRVATVFGVLGGVAALMALGKLMRGKRRPKVPQAPVVTDLDRARMLEAAARPVAVAAQAGPTGLGYATVSTPQSGAWSPLEAVRARQEQEGSIRRVAAPMATPETVEKEKKSWTSPFGTLRKLSMGMAAYAAVYLMATGFQGPFSDAQFQPMLPALKASLGSAEIVSTEKPAGMVEGGMPAVGPLAAKPQRDLPQIGSETAVQRGPIAENIHSDMTPADAALPGMVSREPVPERDLAPVVQPDGEDKSDPVEAVAASLVEQVMMAMRGSMAVAAMGLAGLLMVGVAGFGLARWSRQKRALAQDDPWSRIAERLQ